MQDSSQASMPQPKTRNSRKSAFAMVAASVVMVAIVIAWGATLRSSLSPNTTDKGGLFKSIAEQFRKAFTGDASPSVLGDSDTADSETKLRELRARVFPDFAAVEDQQEASQ